MCVRYHHAINCHCLMKRYCAERWILVQQENQSSATWVICCCLCKFGEQSDGFPCNTRVSTCFHGTEEGASGGRSSTLAPWLEALYAQNTRAPWMTCDGMSTHTCHMFTERGGGSFGLWKSSLIILKGREQGCSKGVGLANRGTLSWGQGPWSIPANADFLE